jgi:transposase
MKAFTVELRQRIVNAVKSGESVANVARLFQVSVSTVRNFVRLDAKGSLEPRKRTGRIDLKFTPAISEAIKKWLEEKNDLTLKQIQQKIFEQFQVEVSQSGIWRHLTAMNITWKKKMTCAKELERPDVAERRENWPAEIGDTPVEKLVFVDESHASTDMAREYGWGQRGERVTGFVPQGHYKTQTMLAGIRLSGPVAPVVFDGSVNSEIYAAWVEQFLIPELHSGDVVIADNLASHKSAKVVELIESAGCRALFLPRYSPDLNPIEPMWSKIKSYLREVEARTVDALYDAVAAALDRVTPSDCLGFYKNSGYC